MNNNNPDHLTVCSACDGSYALDGGDDDGLCHDCAHRIATLARSEIGRYRDMCRLITFEAGGTPVPEDPTIDDSDLRGQRSADCERHWRNWRWPSDGR